MDYREISTLEPGKRSGKPCIRGLRITVEDGLGYLTASMASDAIIDDFPEPTRNDSAACLAWTDA